MSLAILFDLDGVLSNFVAGALLHHGRADVSHSEVRWGIESQLGIEPEPFWAHLGYEFWSSLPLYPDGAVLLDGVIKLVDVARIGLLTSPCDTAGCVDGKRDWVARHLPEFRRRVFVGSAKELFAGPRKILIDDHDANCDKFVAAGGTAVMPPRPWNRRRAECVPGGYFDPASLLAEVANAVG